MKVSSTGYPLAGVLSALCRDNHRKIPLEQGMDELRET